MVEVTPHTAIMLGKSEYCIILLKERSGPRLLPLWVRVKRAQPILLWLKKVPLSRPRTHDLVADVTHKLGAELVRVTMYGIEQGALLSRMIVHKDDEEIAFECASSDAIAVAIKAGIPIMVSDKIMRLAAYESRHSEAETSTTVSGEEEKLAVYRDFVEGLDLSGL